MRGNWTKRLILTLFLLLAVCMPAAYVSAENTMTVSTKGTLKYQEAYDALKYTNQIRESVGAKPLVMDKDLLAAAMQRAAETALYFDHQRPDGTYCYTASSKMSGENIAFGSGTYSANSAVTSWKNSSGHYQNMISQRYQSIGIGCFYTGKATFWVQCFGANTAASVSKPANKSAVMQISVCETLMNGCFGITGPSSQSIEKGKTITISPVFFNAGLGSIASSYPVSLYWNEFLLTSNNPNIVAIANKNSGQLKGVAAGTATIDLSHSQCRSWGGVITVRVTDSNSRNLVLNANGGSLSKSSSVKTQKRSVTYNKKYSSLPTPVRKGYIFKGWYTKKSGGSKITASSKVKIAKGKTQTLYARWSKVSVKKASVSKLQTKAGTVTATWKKISGVKGYELQLSTSSKFAAGTTKVVTVSGSKKSYKFTKLTKEQKYYVKVRAFKTDSLGNKVYGKFSTVKSIKAK